MKTIEHHLLVDAPPSRVYEAIATADGISAWWDKQTPTQTSRGVVLEHNPGREHGVVQLLVVDRVPNVRVEWECISTHPASSPASAWTGTHFIFDLSARDGGTDLTFRQTGYDETSAFFTANVEAWAKVLANLKRVVELQPAGR